MFYYIWNKIKLIYIKYFIYDLISKNLLQIYGDNFSININLFK